MQKTTGEMTYIKRAGEQASDRRSGRCPDLRGKAQPASEQEFQASQATHTHSTNMERRYSAGEKIVEERAGDERGTGAPGTAQGERC